jgi:hypothetical protein
MGKTVEVISINTHPTMAYATATLTTFLFFNSAQTEAIPPPKGETYFSGGLSPNRINGLSSDVHGYDLIRPQIALCRHSGIAGERPDCRGKQSLANE